MKEETVSNALDRYTTPNAPDISDQEWDRLYKRSEQFARSSLVPDAYRNKADDIMAVAITARDLGMNLTLATLPHFFVVKGRVMASTQLMIAMAAQNGHEVWVESSDSEQATVCIQRSGSDRVHRFSFTLEMARRAGLAGKDVWKQYQEAMLIYRAASRGLRVVCPEVLMGLPQSLIADAEPDAEAPDGIDSATGEVVAGGTPTVDQDDDIVDAELVEDKEPGGVDPSEEGEEDGFGEDPSLSTAAVADGGDSEGSPSGPSEAPASDASATEDDRARIRTRLDELGPAWKNAIALEWRKQKLPYLDREALTVGHLEPIHSMLDTFFERKKDAELRRQKHVNAELNEIGIKGADERHAFIKAATNGETQSSAGLTGPQTRAIQNAIDQRKAELADAARQDQAGDTAEETLWDDDDPGRPFDETGRRGD